MIEQLHILNSLGSGVLALDLDGNIVFLNRKMGELLGVTPSDWHGRPGQQLALHVEKLAGSVPNLHLELPTEAGGICSREIEWRSGEKLRYYREDSAALRDSSGRAIGYLFAYHDISRERAIDRMKSEFISVASHELRTPMTSIKGSVDLILSGFAGDASPEMHELLEIAQKSCDRLVRLVNDILDLAKIESGQLKLTRVPTDITEIVVRSICAVKPLADRSEIRLRVERPGPLPMVELDEDCIEQVITNLLSNAVKFSPAKGEVVVEIHTEGDWVQCTVVDKGRGIPEKDLRRIFGKFQQLSEGRKRGGTGLGLAITQALVEEHGGTVWAESVVNEGSRFIFRLPAAAGKPQPLPDPAD